MIGRQNPNSYAKAGNTKIRQNFQSSVNPDCKIRVFLHYANKPFDSMQTKPAQRMAVFSRLPPVSLRQGRAVLSEYYLPLADLRRHRPGQSKIRQTYNCRKRAGQWRWQVQTGAKRRVATAGLR
jgi:hypothetical protein